MSRSSQTSIEEDDVITPDDLVRCSKDEKRPELIEEVRKLSMCGDIQSTGREEYMMCAYDAGTRSWIPADDSTNSSLCASDSGDGESGLCFGCCIRCLYCCGLLRL